MATTTDETAALAASEAAKARKFKLSMKSMKSAVLEAQLILYEGLKTDEQLVAAGKILAQSEYGDVVEERFIAKICGYPRCANELPVASRKGRYRISLSAKKVYDLEESRHFCSPSCLVASKDFGNKLPVQRDLEGSPDRLMEILGLVRGSQYASRSKTGKENDMRKPSARPKSANRGKVRPKGVRNSHPVENRGANLDTVIAPSIELSSSAASTSGSSIESVLIMSSTSGSDGKAAETSIKSSSIGQKVRPEEDSIASTSAVQSKFENLKIQERGGDQKVLPILDYGAPSDAIEGYVPSRSRREAASQVESRTQNKIAESTDSNGGASSSGRQEDQRLKTSAESKSTGKVASAASREEVKRSGSSSRSQQKRMPVVKDWEGLVSGSSQANPAKMCVTGVDDETSFFEFVSDCKVGDAATPIRNHSLKNNDFQGNSAKLKPALKKQSKVNSTVRSVAWADQNHVNAVTDLGKSESKRRASTADAEEGNKSEEGSEEILKFDLLEKQLSQTRLVDSTLDLATANRLASAEAMASALTEAATSAAAGEVDGSEAVVQAGISILSATHNAYPVRSDSSHNAHGQSGETLESMKSSVLNEEELFATAALAREEMRQLKMPRKYAEINEEEGLENGDVNHDFNLKAIEDNDDAEDEEDVANDGDEDDDEDDAEEEDDDDYDDDSGGFEGAREVGYTAPPKGFKAEISMFGTVFMAVEGWISAATVAHFYGKEPHHEDEYLSANGREYSRHTFIGDGVSAEILRTFSLCVSRALPEVVRALRISSPLSTLELSLGRLIKTMSFVEALPPFGTKQWRMLVLLLLDALSTHRIPRLGENFSNNRTLLRQVLDSTGTSEAEYDVFRDVVLPLGRSPTFAARSGG